MKTFKSFIFKETFSRKYIFRVSKNLHRKYKHSLTKMFLKNCNMLLLFLYQSVAQVFYARKCLKKNVKVLISITFCILTIHSFYTYIKYCMLFILILHIKLKLKMKYRSQFHFDIHFVTVAHTVVRLNP